MNCKELSLAVLLSAAFFARAGETLENDTLRIRFAGADAGYSVAAVENRLAGDARFVNPAPGQAGFWRLDFVRKGAAGTNEHVFVDNLASAAGHGTERTAKGMRFIWRGVDIADEKGVIDVFADVDLPQGDAASEWRLSVANRSSTYALYETSYPVLRGVTPPGKGDWLTPYSSLGARLRRGYAGDPKEEVCWMPSCRPPVVAFNIGDAGLYLAAHDPDFRIKKIIVGKGLDVRFETPVEDAGIVGKAAEGPRYAVTLAAYRGDWWQAAKMYKAWALKQRWAAKGPIAKRKDYPKAMEDLDLVFRMNEGDTTAMSNHLAAIRRIWPDLKTGVQWYKWTPQIFCVNFPEFFPARPYVTWVAGVAKREGITLFPYVDARLWDKDMVSWAYAKHDACRDIEGNTVDEIYSPKHKLAVMCPTAPEWSDVVAKLANDAISAPSEAMNGVWFGGVYFDQTACSRPVPCWAPNHGHPKGGGDWWAKSYRRVHAKTHAWCAKRNAPMFSEGTGDMCLDSIDGFLKCTAPVTGTVPFYPAVYAGYAIYYGNNESLKDSMDSFRVYQMRDFTYGVLLGYFDRWNITSPEFAKQQQFIGMLARARRAAKDFMIYGTLEGEIDFAEPVPEGKFTMQTIWHVYDYHHTLPLVMGTVWKNLEGTETALVVANSSDVSQTVRFRLPVRGLALRALPGVTAAEFKEDGDIGILMLPPAVPAVLTGKCR